MIMMFTIEQFDDMITIANHGEAIGLQGMSRFLIVNMNIKERMKISRLGGESICTLLI